MGNGGFADMSGYRLLNGQCSEGIYKHTHVITHVCIEKADVLGTSFAKAVPHAGRDASF